MTKRRKTWTNIDMCCIIWLEDNISTEKEYTDCETCSRRWHIRKKKGFSKHTYRLDKEIEEVINKHIGEQRSE